MTARSCTARVPAKINLGLGVGPLRADGFHTLATVYQAVDLHDEVRAAARADAQITVRVQFEADRRSEDAHVPVDDDNLAVRAAKELRSHLGDESLGVDLSIRKAIPVAGGMAGGSADAVGALVACNALWGGALGRDELEGLAATLGSDVPFLLHGQNAVGSGRGEQVGPVLSRGSFLWVVAIAARGLSTAEVYREFDRLHAGAQRLEPEIPATLMAALRAGDPHELGAALYNDLQAPALSLRPELQGALDISMALTSARVCVDVVTAHGPVPGARLI